MGEPLSINDMIDLWKSFFEEEESLLTQLIERVLKGIHAVEVPFPLLAAHHAGLAQQLLDQPEDVLKAGEAAISQLSLPVEADTIRIRLRDIPHSQDRLIQDLRARDIGKLLRIEGVVKQKTDVRPQVVTARFECPSCGAIIPVLQDEQHFKEPAVCISCGRKGKFRLLSKDLVDAQAMIIEELAEKLEGGEQPKRIHILLKEDLVSPLTERQTNPGSKVEVIGYLKEIQKTGIRGSKSTKFDYLFIANNLIPSGEDFTTLEITPEEEEEILAIAKRPDLYSYLRKAIAPSIYGHDRVKDALILQLAGGVEKVRKDGVRTRGDIHILLVGDPGAGKSQMLKRIARVAPKAKYVSGKGVSGAGLTAAVVRDEVLGGFSLEAGALVLANKGICLIDEMDKMSKEDTSAMHEALEQQTITISKANIHATLPAQTSVLAAANPKYGRFNEYEDLFSQIDMPPALINRFDLIFIVLDRPSEEHDQQMAEHILTLHQHPEEIEETVDDKLLRKYFAYARQRVKPRLTDEAKQELLDYFVTLRNQSKDRQSIPLSARQLEALVRLTEASAKVRLSSEATREDARRAIDLLHYCLTRVATDEHGNLDIDKLVSGISSSKRKKIYLVKKLIEELEKEVGAKVPRNMIDERARDAGIDEQEVEEILQKLMRNGDIYEPQPGMYAILR